ncbi:unnamed protein product [Urochloa decumbens]|uniref:Uncharacterized protein n=1 Tax=Urochloa decumbens TaxID=240449 RepID=A0ABC8Z3C7_9POAL
MESPSYKRRRRNGECERCRCHRAKKKKKHLYLVVDDWKGGYSIHKLDADDNSMEHRLPEHGALRLASSPERAPMAFAALGTNIFIATNPRCSRHRAPPFLAYDTEAAALTVGPPPPDGHLRDLGEAVAAGGKLYALTFFWNEVRHSSSLQVLSWEPTTDQQEAWDPSMEWSWDTLPAPAPYTEGEVITSYALHPDGRTIFMSTDWRTHSLDTGGNGVGAWRDLGEWTLPFRGQAYFDAELDAWVGLHYKEDGYICCCPVASRSATTTTAQQQSECKILEEKLFRRCGEEKFPYGRYLSATLTYMGDSKFCLVESVLRSKNALDAVLHVTVFGLKYDHKRELKTKAHRTTRFYGLSKNTLLFSHAAFWM